MARGTNEKRHQATRPSAKMLRMRIGGRGKATVDAAGARAMLPRFSNFRELGQVLPRFLQRMLLARSDGWSRCRDRPHQPIVRGISSVLRRLRRRRAASLIFFRFLIDGFM